MMFATHIIMESTIKWEDSKGLHSFQPKFTLILAGGEYVLGGGSGIVNQVHPDLCNPCV
jgi:hypothetical protein